MPDSTPIAPVQYARLTVADKVDLLDRLFRSIEYGPAGKPGGRFEDGAIIDVVYDQFRQSGVMFTDPNSLPASYRFNYHTTADGRHCVWAGRYTVEPGQRGGKVRCPDNCPDSVVEGDPEPAPSGYVTLEFGDRASFFRIDEHNELVETVDVDEHGAPIWEAATICDPRAGQLEVQAALRLLAAHVDEARETLAYEEYVAKQKPAQISPVAIAAGAMQGWVTKMRQEMERNPSDRASTDRWYRYSVRGFLGGVMGDFAARCHPGFVKAVAALLTVLTDTEPDPGTVADAARAVAEEFNNVDSDDDSNYYEKTFVEAVLG